MIASSSSTPSMLTLFGIIFSIIWLPGGWSQSQTTTTATCNGLPNLCRMPVNEILFGTVHNAYCSSEAGFYFFPNHDEDPIVRSLDFGYRGLQLDLCNCDGDMVLCHGGKEVGCGFGERDPIDVFNQVNDWIIANPQNVLIIEIQINVLAGGQISLQDVENILLQTNGFNNRLYHHNGGTWPTLEELIDAETQVIFFFTSGPHGDGDHPPGINYFFNYGQATHWSYATIEDLRDRTIGSCTLRGAEGAQDFLMMNAFVTEEWWGVQFVPSRESASVINTIAFTQPMLEACERIHGKKVNIITTDFWDEGNLPALIDLHNSALVPSGGDGTSPVNTPTPAPTPIPTPALIVPTCQDTESSFSVPLIGDRDCGWVDDRSWTRCFAYSDYCPETCGTCN